jgi:F-type H+-transporting ATPase subunit delta
LHDERLRRVRAVVTSAFPLHDGQRTLVVEAIRTRLQLEPVLQERIDPALLGGLVIDVAGWRFDGSIRNRLELIRNHLIERSSHEIQSGRDRFSSD